MTGTELLSASLLKQAKNSGEASMLESDTELELTGVFESEVSIGSAHAMTESAIKPAEIRLRVLFIDIIRFGS